MRVALSTGTTRYAILMEQFIHAFQQYYAARAGGRFEMCSPPISLYPDRLSEAGISDASTVSCWDRFLSAISHVIELIFDRFVPTLQINGDGLRSVFSSSKVSPHERHPPAMSHTKASALTLGQLLGVDEMRNILAENS